MQRYFVPAGQFADRTVVLIGDDAHHAIRVMRMSVGDRFICSNGVDREAIVEITRLAKTTVEATVVEERAMTSEPAVRVWVAQSLPKGDKMDSVVQKCTEIGADRFIPYTSERSIVQYAADKAARRCERWRKIAKEAAEQAHRNRIPAVDEPVSWERILQLAGAADLALICYEKENALELRRLLAERLGRERRETERQPTVLLIVGPEGGFTPQEIAQAEAAGIKPVSLGRRILRTETAAMVGLTCILYESGEMGG